MPDDRMLELLNAEIDGELSAAERAELSQRLLNDPQARTAREELRRTCTGLDALPLAEPPAELRERILAALPQIALANGRGAQGFRRFLPSASALRYAAALAGAVLVGTIAFEANRNMNGLDSDQAAGTMASPPVVARAGQGRLRVDSSQVRGTVTLAPTTKNLRVRFGFDAAQPASAAASQAIDVIVTRGSSQAHLTGLTATHQDSGASMQVELPGEVAAGETTGVRVIASGVLVYEGRWQAPALH
jgi:hypothetical protein